MSNSTSLDSFSPALLADMEAKGIDARLSLSILDDYNAGFYDSVKPVKAIGVPAVDGTTVVNLAEKSKLGYEVSEADAVARLKALGLSLPAAVAKTASGKLCFKAAELKEIGDELLGRTAYGVLNGGSATSYADSKKNLAFGQEVFDALSDAYAKLAPGCRDKPKGITPAYLEPDGSAGSSFLILKMRARLVAAAAAKSRGETVDENFMPLFQMTSVSNDAEVAQAYAEYASHPLLSGLSKKLGISATSWKTGVQPMLAAYTHSSEGRPKKIFDHAHGKENSAIALPGGHGQCFRVLAEVLRDLHAKGLRFAYLGNVDNIAYLPDPLEIAILALSGKPAAFDFSIRTPVDVKGGILVETAETGPDGKPLRTIADIGPAISFDELKKLEAVGSKVLFNCATGLFDLDYFVPRLDEIGRSLPVRFTDQDKDAGRYSQAEQVTWEVASILPSFLAFAVDKYDRFVAAKLLAETLLTSGVAAGDSRLPAELADTSRKLHAALEAKLSGAYGLEKQDGRWVAKAV